MSDLNVNVLEEEIAEDLRRQQLEKFWKENGSWIIAGVILAVIFTGAMTWWRQYSYDRNLQQTSQLLQVLDGSDVDKITAYASGSDKAHAFIARFAAAAIYAKRDEKDKAIAIYHEIENTTGVDRVYRDLARLLSVGQQLNGGDPAALHRDLSTLTAEKSAWRASALEMEALLYAREGRMKEAADNLAEITADTAAPADVRMRASTLRELYIGQAPAGGGKKKTK